MHIAHPMPCSAWASDDKGITVTFGDQTQGAFGANKQLLYVVPGIVLREFLTD